MEKLLTFIVAIFLTLFMFKFSMINAGEISSDKNYTLPPIDVSPIPSHKTTRLSAWGKCTKGSVYTIVRAEDIKILQSDLDCIFFAGIAPSKIPEGSLKGETLAILNTPLLNPIMGFVWRGKTITHVTCPTVKGELYMGYNDYLNYPIAPFIASLGPLPETLGPYEYNDGLQQNLILDYSQDFKNPCQVNPHAYDAIPETNLINWSILLDVIRVVGRQADGGAILLAKSYKKDSQGILTTLFYFKLLSYDPNLNPDFVSGQSLPPLSATFSYSTPGIK